LSSEVDLRVEARLEAYEHLLRHLIVTVLARTQDPLDAFDGFQKRITGPLKRKPTGEFDPADADQGDLAVLEIIDWVAKGVRDDIQRALGSVTVKRR
jgi:hypothetical protein